MTKAWLLGAALAGVACAGADKPAKDSTAAATPAAASAAASAGGAASACPGDNGGLTLPAGFCATVFADKVGHARHLVVAPNGDVYVNNWSGPYYQDKPDANTGFLLAARDTNHDGVADVLERFGATAGKGGRGGTGIALYGGALYAEEGTTIVKYPLASGELSPKAAAATIVTGLPITGDHPMHPFAIDSSGAMYMNSGSPSNSCQVKNRTLQSPGKKPCEELATRAGIWKFDAKKTDQAFSPAQRYATGIRNAVGITIGPDGGPWSTQHGRDQLAENWPKLYTADQGQNLPAEELLRIEQNADYGWPECYFDNGQGKLVLAPEYGGDGGKTVGACAQKKAPEGFFPAHWAPDGLVFYTGTQFPASYRGGAFIAFHGSWNRAPGPQGGYVVAFIPFANGHPVKADSMQIFADGFAGANKQPDAAAHRPTGLAVGPDGALYIADDKGGRVWRVTYRAR